MTFLWAVNVYVLARQSGPLQVLLCESESSLVSITYFMCVDSRFLFISIKNTMDFLSSIDQIDRNFQAYKLKWKQT